MAMRSQQYIKLAEALPPRLTKFFARYPTPAILPPTSTSTSATPPSTSPASGESTPAAAATPEYFNPFQVHKHPVTGKWHNPVFSLRRQADIVKLARKHGVEELLPFTVKSTAERLRKRAENGLRVKGTGIGQKVKGKESERTMKGRLEKRKKAMLEMPQMIQTWKERGHGRGWKKWPK